MPRYYVDTYDGFVALDAVGHDYPDDENLRAVVRMTLVAMMKDVGDGRPSVQLRADVRDESGDRVMTATLLMVIEETVNKPVVLKE